MNKQLLQWAHAWRRSRWLLLALLAAGALAAWARPVPAAPPEPAQLPAFRILLFSRTEGYRHAAIPAAIAAIRGLGSEEGFAVDSTEDAAMFSDIGLVPYAAVVFLMTTGDVLDESQQAAFERYIAAGGGYAGIHSASDTEYGWPWYGGLVGAYFANHPRGTQRATILVENRLHPSTADLPLQWQRTDEWYNFQTNPRARVQVLARLDETTYNGGTMGADHPIAWYHAYAGGRAWYTAGGHSSASYSEELFLAHILGGIRYAAGVAPAEPSTPTSTPTATNTPPTLPVTTPTPSATPTATGVAGAPPQRPQLWLPLTRR